MPNEFYPFNIYDIDSKLYNKICKLFFEKLQLRVNNIIAIQDNKTNKIKTYKIITDENLLLRLDIKHLESKTKLQLIVNKYDIEIPRIIGIFGKYKVSEWIDGTMLLNVVDIPEVFIKSGELMARLNSIKIDNKFVTNSEFSLSNAIWTKDKKVYLIDHGKMRLVNNTDKSIVQILLKRIKDKTNIELFLKGYSKYKEIYKIKQILDKYNYNWENYAA